MAILLEHRQTGASQEEGENELSQYVMPTCTLVALLLVLILSNVPWRCVQCILEDAILRAAIQPI